MQLHNWTVLFQYFFFLNSFWKGGKLGFQPLLSVNTQAVIHCHLILDSKIVWGTEHTTAKVNITKTAVYVNAAFHSDLLHIPNQSLIHQVTLTVLHLMPTELRQCFPEQASFLGNG